MTFEEIDERYRDAALDDDTGDGWDDPAESADEDPDADDLGADEEDEA
jgi:hypothetical protein